MMLFVAHLYDSRMKVCLERAHISFGFVPKSSNREDDFHSLTVKQLRYPTEKSTSEAYVKLKLT